VYDKAGFFEESYRSAQDHDMLIRIAEVARFAYLQDFLFFYRRHPGSISSTKQALRWETGFRILASAAQRHPYRRSTLRKRKAVLNYRLGRARLQERRYLPGMLCLAQAFLLDPRGAVKVMLGLDKSQ